MGRLENEDTMTQLRWEDHSEATSKGTARFVAFVDGGYYAVTWTDGGYVANYNNSERRWREDAPSVNAGKTACQRHYDACKITGANLRRIAGASDPQAEAASALLSALKRARAHVEAVATSDAVNGFEPTSGEDLEAVDAAIAKAEAAGIKGEG